MWVFMAVAAAEGGPGCDKEARREKIHFERIRMHGGAQSVSGVGLWAGPIGRNRGRASGPGGPIESRGRPLLFAAPRSPGRGGAHASS
jgi:hypothetical protein